MNAKEKGRGVVTTKVFEKDEYICEYGGHLIRSKHQVREAEHEHEQGGTFMFYFEHKGRKLWYTVL